MHTQLRYRAIMANMEYRFMASMEHLSFLSRS